MTHATGSTGRTLIPAMVIASLALFPLGNACQASVTPQALIKAGGTTSQTVRAKRAVKKSKRVVAKAAPRVVSPAVAASMATGAAAVMAPAAVALKPSAVLGAAPPAAALVPAPAPANSPRVNPYLVNQVQYGAAPAAPVAAAENTSPMAGGGFKLAMPQIPLFEQAILPKIQTVYPTGEKPLVVVTFKCPTELVGIDTPSTVILHKAVNGGMDLINKTNLLSFNMQQVCQ